MQRQVEGLVIWRQPPFSWNVNSGTVSVEHFRNELGKNAVTKLNADAVIHKVN